MYAVLGLAIALSNHLQGNLSGHRERMRVALVAARKAAKGTRALLADLGFREFAPTKIEELRSPEVIDKMRSVSDLWVTAGEEIRRCSGHFQGRDVSNEMRQLSERCFKAGKYWAVPSGWTSSDVEEQLEKLMEEITEGLEGLHNDPIM